MQKSLLHFNTKTMLLVVFFVSYILAAYCRGNQLLGANAGVTYALVATFMALLFVRPLSQTPPRPLHISLLVAFAIPASLAFAFPGYVNPGVQHFIDKQTVDRNARAELANLYSDDSTFQDLSVTTKHLKVVNVEIRGSVPTRPDLLRLQSRVLSECDFVQKCAVHWRIHVHKESRTYTGMGDEELIDVAI